jgi:hypothetical protein
MIFLGLVSKSVATVFFVLASKLVVTVSSDLGSKLLMSFLVEPQNHDGGEFLGLGLKTVSYGLVIWVLKSQRQFLGLRPDCGILAQLTSTRGQIVRPN